jgi:hypothetical protein
MKNKKIHLHGTKNAINIVVTDEMKEEHDIKKKIMEAQNYSVDVMFMIHEYRTLKVP